VEFPHKSSEKLSITKFMWKYAYCLRETTHSLTQLLLLDGESTFISSPRRTPSNEIKEEWEDVPMA